MGATMNRQAWAAPMNAVEAYRRASGRRRYNAARRRAVNRRLVLLIRQIAAEGDIEGEVCLKQPKPLPRHLIPALAKVLGVHRTTVWRDLQRLRRWPNRAWEYRGNTDKITVWLYGLTKFAFKLGGGLEE